MQRLSTTAPASLLSDADLAEIYAYPPNLDRSWVQANFVSSLDGAVTIDGRSEGLSHPADKRIYHLGRALCDVVLVGAGTARAERYGGVELSPGQIDHRISSGLTPAPSIAVVTRTCMIDPRGPLLTEAAAPPIVITINTAPEDRRAALVEAGATVITAGTTTVDLNTALHELTTRRLLKVNCEGGPLLFAEMLTHDLVDQLCLTLAPHLVGGGEARMLTTPMVPRHLTLTSVLHEDGLLMLQYRRNGSKPSADDKRSRC